MKPYYKIISYSSYIFLHPEFPPGTPQQMTRWASLGKRQSQQCCHTSRSCLSLSWNLTKGQKYEFSGSPCLSESMTFLIIKEIKFDDFEASTKLIQFRVIIRFMCHFQIFFNKNLQNKSSALFLLVPSLLLKV